MSMNMNHFAVILCGGSGTRLWPLSRNDWPKQFHRFSSDATLFEATVARAAQAPGISGIYIICNEAHRFMAATQAQNALQGSALPVCIVLEPQAKNTAPAIAAIAHLIALNHGPQALMMVLPSDQHMVNWASFNAASALAFMAAQQGLLCTFGIKPTAPETGFGYIAQGAAIDGLAGAHRVANFIEKPNAATAQSLIADGLHTWNCGMFFMQASVFLQELAQFEPQIHAATQAAAAQAQRETDFTRLNAAAFATSPSISVDYAVFERTQLAAVVRYDGDWSDLGSWAAVAQLARQHPAYVPDIHVQIDTTGSHVHASRYKAVALVGVQDLVVVDTPDALLVVHTSASQQVKQALAQLQTTAPHLALAHRKTHRPWGWFDPVQKGEGFQTKRIHVYPGASLSLQSHAHRAEHWVIVQGNATVTLGSTLETALEKDYPPGHHVYIPLGAVHRLSNKTTTPVEIIEVQCGNYLGEDDIMRYEDIYGRV